MVASKSKKKGKSQSTSRSRSRSVQKSVKKEKKDDKKGKKKSKSPKREKDKRAKEEKEGGSEENGKVRENGKEKSSKDTKSKRSRSSSPKKTQKKSRSRSSSRSRSQKRRRRSSSRKRSKSSSRSRSRSRSQRRSRSKSKKRDRKKRKSSHSRKRSRSRRKSRSRSRRRRSKSKSKRSRSKSPKKEKEKDKEKDKTEEAVKVEPPEQKTEAKEEAKQELTIEEKAAILAKEMAATELLMAERRERVKLEQAKKASKDKFVPIVDASLIPAEFRKDKSKDDDVSVPLSQAEMGEFKSPEEVKLILELEKKFREEDEAERKAKEVKVERKPVEIKPNAGFSMTQMKAGVSLLGGKKIEIKTKKKLGGFDFESAAELGAQKDKERKERLAREEAEKKRQEREIAAQAPPTPPPEQREQQEEERRALLEQSKQAWHSSIKEATARGEQRKKIREAKRAAKRAQREEGGEGDEEAEEEDDDEEIGADLEDGVEPEEVSAEPVKSSGEDALDQFMAPVNSAASTEIAQSIEKAEPLQAMYGVPGTVAPGIELEQQWDESEAQKPESEPGERFYMNEEKYSDDDLDEEEKEDWLAKQQLKGKGKELKPVDHKKMKYIEFRKKFYIESPEITAMTEEEVTEYRDKELEGVSIRGKGCPRPIKKWIHCGLSAKVYRELEKGGMTTPFPIQAQAIPAIMSGRDVIACAKTGSGKTLAFVLPMLRHIMDQPELGATDGPIGIVMCPTRELAVQIHQDIARFAKKLELRNVAIYGGAGIAAQINALKAGAEIITCTPGRMIDMLCANNGRVTNLTRCTYCVLDEADRMFDMGFAPQIMAIIENMRPDRQTVMFSATFPRTVEMLAKKALTSPIEIIIGGRSTASTDVKQIVEVRSEDSKFRRLLELLGKWYAGGDNILIFVDKQEHVDHLYRQLHDAGYPGLALHGGMDQADRDFTLADFKSKLRTILVSTSLCARGLDVRDLVLVINYTAPNHYEDYVHRVGRTGRAGKKGTAITFITPEEERMAPDLVKALAASKQTVPQDLQKMADAFNEKRHTGAVQWYSNDGYKTKGFHFNAEEDVAKKTEALAMKAGYVEDDAAAQAAAESVQEQQMILAEKKLAAQEEKKELDPIKSQIQKGKVVVSAVLNALKQSVSTTGQISTKAAADAQEAANKAHAANDSIRGQGSAAARAFAVAMTIKNELGKKAGGFGMNFDGTHACELEINDYPQHARFKATQKKTFDTVFDLTEATVTTKGMWVPPGRNAMHGERKLYLSIEGKTEASVRSAKKELLRILEEAALEAKPEKELYSKYAVMFS